MPSPIVLGLLQLKWRPLLFVVGGLTAILLFKWKLDSWYAVQQRYSREHGPGRLLWTPFSALAFGGVFFAMPLVVLLALCATHASAGWLVVAYALAGVACGVLILSLLIKYVFLPRERRLFLDGCYKAPSDQTPSERARTVQQDRRMRRAAVAGWVSLAVLLLANPARFFSAYSAAVPLFVMGFLCSALAMLGVFLLFKRKWAWREETPMRIEGD